MAIAGTAGRETIGCASSAVAALDKETIRHLNQLHELAGEVERLFAHAEALDELAALSPDEGRSDQLKREAAEARADAAKKGKRAERLNRKLEESNEAREQNVRRAVRRGLAEAMAEVEQANDAVKAFGGGYDAGLGTENGAGGRNSLSTNEDFDKLAEWFDERDGRNDQKGFAARALSLFE